ncbi:MAG: phosphatidylserine/phosphatidylglycerophosphate/cardiolipin synthase family protein [Bacteriovorax sp.]|jgi:putative cardiolipin synthase
MKSWLFLCCIYFAQNMQAAESDPFNSREESNHQITLLNHGLGSFEARLQMIEKAQKSIDVEYFIYNLDKSGRIFTQALIKRANEGVKIRILLDYFMAKSENELNPFLANELEKSGIEVKYFNTTSTLNLFSGQRRNHRKLLLIDSNEAITGGRNLGDEYFDLVDDFNFLDRDLQVSGPIAQHIQSTFDQFWNSKLSVKIEREKKPEPPFSSGENELSDRMDYEREIRDYNLRISAAKNFLTIPEALYETIREHGKNQLALAYRGNCSNMSINTDYATIDKKAPRITKNNLAERIRNARESILFDSTYFIVDNEFKNALETALENKVKVSLLTNSIYSSDAIYVVTAFDSIIRSWILKGLEPHIFKGILPEDYPTMTNKISNGRFGIHAKSFVFDNKDVVIGTFNFDPRSANLNNEMTISCDNNPELARYVSEDIERRMRGSILLDSTKKADDFQFYKAGFFKKMGYYILKYPSILFDYLL